MGFPENILNSGDYNTELETNTVKKRVGFYIHKNVSYVKRFDLEKENLHIVIIDVKSDLTLRQINLYSPYSRRSSWAASLKWGIPYKIAIIGIQTQLNIDELGLDSHAFKETSPQLLDYKHQEQHL